MFDHYHNPRNRGELPVPPARRVEGYDRLCGDEVVVYVDTDGGRLNDIKISGEGCSISKSSASVMSVVVMGQTVEEAQVLVGAFSLMMSSGEHQMRSDGADAHDTDLVGTANLGEETLRDLEALQDVVRYPLRINCAMLPWTTLQHALDEAAAGT